MYKTVSVHIGNIPLLFEEKAFATLDTYLQSLKKHFGTSNDGEEIVSDIEARMAEELKAALKKGKKVIVQKDVDVVIAGMGTIKDFKEFEEDANSEKSKSWSENLKSIRLYRDKDDQVIGGVCAGIAHYFTIDPLIVRLIFGSSLFFGGIGFFLYVLLLIIVPEAQTTAEKVEMTGNRVTLSSLQKRIDEVVPPERQKTIFRTCIQFPFLLLKKICDGFKKVDRFIVSVFGRIVGFVASVGGAIGMTIVTSVLIILLLNPHSPYIGFPIGEAIGMMPYVILLIATYCIVMVPVIFLLLIGISLLFMRNIFSTGMVAGLVGCFLIGMVTVSVTGFSIAPIVEDQLLQQKARSHEAVTREFPFHGFNAIEAEGRIEMHVVQGDEYTVAITGTEDDLKRTSITMRNGVLRYDESFYICLFFCESGITTVEITMPSLEGIEISGIASASIDGFSAEKFFIRTNGIGKVEAKNMNITHFSSEINGASRILVEGTGSTIASEINGVGTLDAYAFSAQNAAIEINGPSHIMLNATDTISGEINGPGTLHYRIHPTVLSVEKNGPARIIQEGKQDDGE